MAIKIRNFGNTAPRSACCFPCSGGVALAATDVARGGQVSQIRLVGYRGDVTEHWFWGNLAIDLKGLKFAKPVTPGLMDHDVDRRITFSQDRGTNPEVFIEGPFLATPDASRLRDDLAAGFPFEASLSVIPTRVEQIAEGAEAQANGRTVKGPGAIFREASIREISATVLGAFPNSETSALAASEGDEIVQFEVIKTPAGEKRTDRPITLESLKSENSTLYTAIFDTGKDAGIQAERQRFAAVLEACGGFPEVAAARFAEGESLAAAQAKIAGRLRKLYQLQIALSKPEGDCSDGELKARFAAVEKLQDEFSCADAYIEFVRHAPSGR